MKKIKINYILSISMIFVGVIALSSIIQSCEKEPINKKYESEFIDLPENTNGTLWTENKEYRDKYVEAKKRFNKSLYLENNELKSSVGSGSEINISESLFSTLKKGSEKFNEIAKAKKVKIIMLDNNDFTLKSSFGKNILVRLKSGQTEGSNTPKDLSGSDQSVGLNIVAAFLYYGANYYNISNLSELFNLASGNFSVTKSSKSGSFTLNGQVVNFYISDGCASFGSPSNCSGNYICEPKTTTNSFQIRSCDGLVVASLTASTSSGTAAIQEAIKW